jgi:sigma54-dependent transcription regulator
VDVNGNIRRGEAFDGLSPVFVGGKAVAAGGFDAVAEESARTVVRLAASWTPSSPAPMNGTVAAGSGACDRADMAKLEHVAGLVSREAHVIVEASDHAI